MSKTTATSSSGGMGLVGWLTVLFVGLKLTDNIDWSWWWVLSPLWITGLFVVAILLAAFGFVMHDERKRYKRRTRARKSRI